MTTALHAGEIARRTIITLLVSAIGGALVAATGLPAGWLMGGAIAAAIAALSGVKVTMPNWLRDVTFVLTGLSMGASVAKDSLTMMLQWPVTLAALAVELILIIAMTGYLLRKLFGLDRGTAYLSSFPGHLSFVMSIAAAGVGDPRQIIIMQVTRILLLTLCVPFGALLLPIGPYVVGADEAWVCWESLLLVTAACTVTGLVFMKLKVPAAFVLGAMATSITMKLAGLFDGRMPPPLLIVTFIMIGALIGSRFGGITMKEFRQAVVGGLAGTALTVAITTVVTIAILPLVDMPFGQIWLGLSPGGLEAMGALGIALGFDTAFIAAHHVARLLLLTVAIPVVAVLVRSKEPPRP